MASRVRSTTSTYRPGAPPRAGRNRPTGTMGSAAVTARGPAGQTLAKLFANGRSQAVRLPKEFRFTGDVVRITREGNRVILEPLDDGPHDAKGWPIDLWATLDAIDGDFPDIAPLPVRLLTPDDLGPLAPPTKR